MKTTHRVSSQNKKIVCKTINAKQKEEKKRRWQWWPGIANMGSGVLIQERLNRIVLI